MAEIIRRIEDTDFEAVSAFYNGRKSIEELKWLFTNPDDPGVYNAFVATKESKIVGVIGYVLSDYVQDKRIFSGTIPISWKIESHYKGMAGVLLFKKVMNLGEFGITIAGSETAKDLYTLFKYKYVSNIEHFYKILNLKNTYKSLHRKNFIKTLGMFGYLLPSYFSNSKDSALYKDIELIKYDGSNYVEDVKYDSVLKKQTNKNYIDWLLACPILKPHAFIIKKENEFLGTGVLYIKEEKNIRKGRIVHLPYLGEDLKIWESVIEKCIAFLKEEGCCIIESVAHNRINQEAYKKTGFINIQKHSKPLYIKDSKELLRKVDLKNWFLQYSEGDKSYRSF